MRDRRAAMQPVDMAELPVQRPSAPRTLAQARARFFNSANAFNLILPPVPARVFDDVAAEALASTRTAEFDCDQSAPLGCAFAATTPLMLARYVRVAPGESLGIDAIATGLIGYVIEGDALCNDAESGIALGTGDVVLLPGGRAWRLSAGPRGMLLWLVGNQPQLAFERAHPVSASIEAVHFPACEIARQLDLVYACATNADTAGHALVFSCERDEASRNLTPTLTLSLNTLAPQSVQPAHRHNSAAITLVLQGRDCHSSVAGRRCDWRPFTTLVTPPGAAHSHHNEGAERSLFLIVQDGGLHYHARTMGFEVLPPPAVASPS